MTIETGSRLGHCDVTKHVGEGGMGLRQKVWR